jgi:hypothetical protein
MIITRDFALPGNAVLMLLLGELEMDQVKRKINLPVAGELS